MSERVKVKSRSRLRAVAWPESSNSDQQWQVNCMEARLETSTKIWDAIHRGVNRSKSGEGSIDHRVADHGDYD
jgi:hypothetical protein